VPAVVVVGTEFSVGRLIGQHMVGRDEEGVSAATTAFLWPRCRRTHR
jgi:hypothetical protein